MAEEFPLATQACHLSFLAPKRRPVADSYWYSKLQMTDAGLGY